MHPALLTPVAGTRLPPLAIGGRTVPAAGARWTLVVLGDDAPRAVDWHRRRLAAEAVVAVALPDPAAAHATVLVDPLGVVQHVGGGVEEALDVVRDLRVGEGVPLAAPERSGSGCPDPGRRRRAVWRARRPAH